MKSQENADSGSRWANKHHQALANTVRGCIKVAPVITILKAKKARPLVWVLGVSASLYASLQSVLTSGEQTTLEIWDEV